MRKPTARLLLFVSALVSSRALSAQVNTGASLPAVIAPPTAEPQRTFDAAELDRIASPIALYPDPLLAQVLSAATHPSEIPAAQQWVEARRGYTAEQLATALVADRVSWDLSVQSLIAFPTVLQMMATSMAWTEEIGDAFKLQHEDVMDAVQRLRVQAQRYGYLRSTPELRVVASTPSAIEIVPVNPSYIVVPYYNPVVVFAPPRPRFLVSSAIYLGFGVRLGAWYEPYGWRSSGFYWPTHRVVVGFPGWNSRYGYREVSYEQRYDARRYEPRRHEDPRYAVPRSTPHAVVTHNGYIERPREVRNDRENTRYEGVGSRERSRDSSKDNRDMRSGGESRPPRAEQPRQSPPSGDHATRTAHARGRQ